MNKVIWTCVGIFAVGTVAGIVGKNVYDKQKHKRAVKKAQANALAMAEKFKDIAEGNKSSATGNDKYAKPKAGQREIFVSQTEEDNG